MEPNPAAGVRVGDVVDYTSRAGITYPAVLTEFTDTTGLYAHLFLMPPPHQAADRPDHEWGFPHESEVVGVDRRGCWQAREAVS